MSGNDDVTKESNTPDEETVVAHDQHETIHLLRHYPDHEPRPHDPNYHLFNRTRARLEKQGLLKCVVDNTDCDGPISLHHSHFEFAYMNDVDVSAAEKILGLHLSDEEFAEYVEQEGNLEPLCHVHHIGALAIHIIPTADWDIVRAHKLGTNPVVVVRNP